MNKNATNGAVSSTQGGQFVSITTVCAASVHSEEDDYTDSIISSTMNSRETIWCVSQPPEHRDTSVDPASSQVQYSLMWTHLKFTHTRTHTHTMNHSSCQQGRAPPPKLDMK